MFISNYAVQVINKRLDGVERELRRLSSDTNLVRSEVFRRQEALQGELLRLGKVTLPNDQVVTVQEALAMLMDHLGLAVEVVEPGKKLIKA